MNTPKSEQSNLSVASELSISDVAMIKAAQAKLQSITTIRRWGDKVIAEALGKPIYITHGMDHRKVEVPDSFFPTLRHLIRMFALDRNLEYKRHPELFDRSGYRSTSYKELSTSRDRFGSPYMYSVSQIELAIRRFEAIGFIERCGKPRLHIRLRADNVLKAKDRVAKLDKPDRGAIKRVGATITTEPIQTTNNQHCGEHEA